MVLTTDILYKDMVKREGRWTDIAVKLMEVRLQAKALELIEKEYNAELIELSQGRSSYDTHGYVFKIFERKGTVDYKRIPQLHNVDLEPFRKESSEYWRLDLVQIKKDQHDSITYTHRYAYN